MIKTVLAEIFLKIFGKLIREIKYRKRLKEMRKRDPFIY